MAGKPDHGVSAVQRGDGLSGQVRDGKCGGCGRLRGDHFPDGDGLRLLCPNGTGGIFRWPKVPGRVSASFSREEIRALDVIVAHAMGASLTVSKTNPVLVAIRRKTMKMRKKAEG